jgi:hypothetical protein
MTPRRLLLLACLLGAAFSTPAIAAEPVAEGTPTPVHTGNFFGIPRGNRVVAAGLSLGLNGLGQVYNEEPEKGFGMMSAWLTFPLAFGLDALTGRAYGRVFSYAVNVGVKGWSVVDAYNGAAPYPTPTPTPVPTPTPQPTPTPAASPKP